MIKPLILCFWSFVQVYMFCDFGENVTNGFASLNETIFACNWYTSSTEIQKMVIVIMISMQKTMIIRGFGNIPSTREAFKKVNILQRFLMFKQNCRKYKTHLPSKFYL